MAAAGGARLVRGQMPVSRVRTASLVDEAAAVAGSEPPVTTETPSPTPKREYLNQRTWQTANFQEP